MAIASISAPRLHRFGGSTTGLRAGGIRTVPARASRRSAVVEARKVALLGAAGGIGQPLALLLKMNKLVTELALYDIQGTPGVAADLSHCNTPVKVSSLPYLTSCVPSWHFLWLSMLLWLVR